ncbi:unnamed protein product, partial [Prorocentrum cordatum]
DYGLAQDRHRVFLRGLRTRGSKIPMPLPPFGERKLVDFLARGLPPTPRDSLTDQMRKNLSEYERSGEVVDDDVVCFGLDRRLASVYAAPITHNCAPCLTTKNRYLFVVRIGDLSLPYGQRTMCRWLTPAERFGLQGFAPNTVQHLSSEGLAVQAAGNACPVPLVIAAVQPMLQHLASGGDGAGHGNIPARQPEPLSTAERVAHRLAPPSDARRSPPKKAGKGPGRGERTLDMFFSPVGDGASQ